jgi:hypothetical protein
VELVYTLDLGSSAERHGGSTPPGPTLKGSRPGSLVVRTRDFQSRSRGSIPRRGAYVT